MRTCSLQAERDDRASMLGAHLAVAGQHQLEARAPVDEHGASPRPAAAGPSARTAGRRRPVAAPRARRPRRGVEGLVEAAVHDLDLGPVARCSTQRYSWLRPNELIADDEAGATDLLAEAERCGRVELFGAVHGEAVAAGRRARAPASPPRPSWCRNAREMWRRRRARSQRATAARLGEVDRGGRASERSDLRDMRSREREAAARKRTGARDRGSDGGTGSASAPPAARSGCALARRRRRVRESRRPSRATRCARTSTPCRSSARISRRMKLWLTFGYWLTR